jgi:hypothetical protein
MKTIKFSGISENAYGKAITPLKYETAYDAYEGISEVRAANDYPSDADVVKFLNAQRKANARQKAMQAAWDAAGLIKPTLENDEQLRLKSMFKILVAAGKSESEAKTLASATLGIEWSKSSDEQEG